MADNPLNEKNCPVNDRISVKLNEKINEQSHKINDRLAEQNIKLHQIQRDILEEQKRMIEEHQKLLEKEMANDANYHSKFKPAKWIGATENRLIEQGRKQVALLIIPYFLIFMAIMFAGFWHMGIKISSVIVIPVLICSFIMTSAIGCGIYFVFRHSRIRMAELSNGLERAANGDLDYRLDLDDSGPFAQAYTDYNNMCERIKVYQDSLVAAVDEADRANQAKSDFLSNMSHEIRTPMNAIVGMTDILLRTDLEQQQKEYLLNIKNSGAALLTIINDILDFSKIESGKMEIVEDNYEPMSMFNDLSMIFLNRIGEKDIDLVYDIDPAFPSGLYGDSLRIRQILINIMNNAIKFTDKGTVTLRCRVQEMDNEKARFLFEISDTGQGIREEDLDKLFGSFSQVDAKKNHHKEGTGLGLAISKQLVELMNGQIGVRSTYGEGSTFFFTVEQTITRNTPISIKEGPQVITIGSLEYGSTEIDDTTEYTAPTAKILVVDDNEMNLKVACGILEPLKMSIDTACDGKNAISKAKSKEYDMIFMDHMMPVMDGLEATEHIRAMEDIYFKTVPIVALTANAVQSDRDRFFEVGMNDFLAKPFSYKDISACIKQWLPTSKIKLAEDGDESTDNGEGVEKQSEQEQLLAMPDPEGLDVAAGIEACGSRKMYMSLLGDFYKTIDMKSTKIEKCLADGLIKDYTIEVHALKNTSRMIGDLSLSAQFKHLEELGDAEAIDEINTLNSEVMNQYRGLKPILEPYARAQECEKKETDQEEIIQSLRDLHNAIDAFDLDGADAAMGRIKGYKFPFDATDEIIKLEAYVADVAMEEILQITDELIRKFE